MSLSGIRRRGRLARAARLFVLIAVIVLSAVAVVHFGRSSPLAADLHPINAFGVRVAPDTPASTEFRYERLTGPGRTVVRDSGGAVLATLTDGARTAVLAGPARTFRLSGAASPAVNNNEWVRLTPQPWAGGAERATWFPSWLRAALADRGPDVLAVAMKYRAPRPAAPDVRTFATPRDHAGEDGRQRPADFYDYLGIPWTFPDGVRRKPSADLAGKMNSPGFVRLVFGYRMGYPMRSSDRPGAGLPRGAVAMSQPGPGVPITPDRVPGPARYNVLQPGDLVFFDADPGNGKPVDSVGIYVGMDTDGHHRFVAGWSAPARGDGALMLSLDDGDRFFQWFRCAKRI